MKLELSIDQLNVVIAGLQEIPHKHSDPIIREIIRQVEEQKPGEKPADPTEPEGDDNV